jgi:hypothetical protein
VPRSRPGSSSAALGRRAKGRDEAQQTCEPETPPQPPTCPFREAIRAVLADPVSADPAEPEGEAPLTPLAAAYLEGHEAVQLGSRLRFALAQRTPLRQNRTLADYEPMLPAGLPLPPPW